MSARAVQPFETASPRSLVPPGSPGPLPYVPQGERECGVHAAELEQPHGRAPQEAAGAGRGEHGLLGLRGQKLKGESRRVAIAVSLD